jgi:hypothetical protein
MANCKSNPSDQNLDDLFALIWGAITDKLDSVPDFANGL